MRTLAVAALAAGLIFPACKHEPRADATREAVQSSRGGTFRMAQDTPASLDPACLDDVYEATIVNQIFDGLLRFDANLNVVPCIAESWELSADGCSYTIHLKPGVRFHDGTELTADDVIFSFTRVFDLPEQETALAREYLGHITGSREYARHEATSISGLKTLGHYDVGIELERPFTSFLAALASEPTRIVPRRYVERVGNERFGREPVGCGPFRWKEWTQDRIVLAVNEEYGLGTAWLDSLVFELPGDGARDVAAESFLAGRLSAAIVPHGRLSEFKRRPESATISRQELSLSFIGLNEKRPPFDDLRVRQAFALAIDRDEILHPNAGERIAPDGILPPGLPGYTPEPKLFPHDPERARALLAAAGHPEGRGLPRIVFTTASQNEESRSLFATIQRQVAAVGFRLESEELNWLEFSRRLTSQTLQCFNITWVADMPDPDSFLYPLGHRDGSANFTRYRNDEVDTLLEQGRGSRNALDRMAIYREAERRIIQDAPIVPLFHPVRTIAVQAGVRGFHMTPMGIGYIAMEDIWLQTAMLAGEPR
jgi:peptide/nickel transport system substrate-binding protein/oligopeptide transport system substrate-binding protein